MDVWSRRRGGSHRSLSATPEHGEVHQQRRQAMRDDSPGRISPWRELTGELQQLGRPPGEEHYHYQPPARQHQQQQHQPTRSRYERRSVGDLGVPTRKEHNNVRRHSDDFYRHHSDHERGRHYQEDLEDAVGRDQDLNSVLYQDRRRYQKDQEDPVERDQARRSSCLYHDRRRYQADVEDWVVGRDLGSSSVTKHDDRFYRTSSGSSKQRYCPNNRVHGEIERRTADPPPPSHHVRDVRSDNERMVQILRAGGNYHDGDHHNRGSPQSQEELFRSIRSSSQSSSTSSSQQLYAAVHEELLAGPVDEVFHDDNLLPYMESTESGSSSNFDPSWEEDSSPVLIREHQQQPSPVYCSNSYTKRAAPPPAPISHNKCLTNYHRRESLKFGKEDDEHHSTSPYSRTPGAETVSHSRTIEIAPGQSERLRGADETWRAIACDFYMPCECICCSLTIFCIQDAKYVLCPDCRVVSLMSSDGDVEDDVKEECRGDGGGGVGLGFTMEDLARWQEEIERERSEKEKLDGYGKR